MQQQGSYADAYVRPQRRTAGRLSSHQHSRCLSTCAHRNCGHRRRPLRRRSLRPPPSQTAPPADHYGSAPPPTSNPYAAPAAPTADPAAAAYTADNRYANPYAGAAQPEQAAADHYGAQQSADPYGTGNPAAPPAAPPAAAPPAGGYQPGTSSYTPGDTGYSPPGVPKYEMPAQPNVIANRSDPHYRPGGTGDYLGGAPTATATADRYNNPAAAYSQGSPYMAPDGSNSPSKGYTQ